MTENEAKKNLETYIYSELESIPKQLLEAVKIACQALGEIQQYRKHNITVEGSLDTMRDLSDVTEAIRQYWAIGTVEECRAWKEKQNAKKVISFDYNNGTVNYGCPVCKRKIISKIDGKWCGGTFNEYCDRCGQKLDWRNDNE